MCRVRDCAWQATLAESAFVEVEGGVERRASKSVVPERPDIGGSRTAAPGVPQPGTELVVGRGVCF